MIQEHSIFFENSLIFVVESWPMKAKSGFKLEIQCVLLNIFWANVGQKN